MDFRIWWMLYMISTFASGYQNENCVGISNWLWNLLDSCNHVQDRGTFNCTGVSLVRLESSNVPTYELIHKLILKKCCLNTIDADAFDKLTYLSFLDMSYNSLEVLNYKLFKQTKSLSYINLSYNELESIDFRLFNSTMELWHIDLSHNNLKTFDYRLFEQQKQLKHINLEHNKLYTLHDIRVFRAQSILKELLMGNNLITTIDVNVLKPLKNIMEIELAGNPFVCQCHIKQTVDWCLNRSLETNASCEYPPEVKGISWDFLSTFPECEKNMSLEIFPIKQVTNELLASRSVIKALIIALVFTGIIVLVIISILLYFCWRNHRGVRSGSNETAKRSSQELIDYHLYESVSNTGENISSNTSLTPAVSDKGMMYDYVTPIKHHINAAVIDSENNTHLKKDTTDFSPAEQNIENELYS